MKVIQVFDCQDMPLPLRKTFFDLVEQGNDTYVSWELNSDWYGEGHQKSAKEIDDWLKASGATDKQVLINHWW
jgi:hypothetical protein